MITAQIGLIPHATNPFQWLIQTITRSPVHHCVIAISETECVGAEAPVAIVRLVTHWPTIIWSAFDLNARQQRLIAGWANNAVGTKYGWLDDLAIAIALITRKQTPLWLTRYITSTKRLQCAELVDMAYRAAGIHLFRDGRPPSAVYPGSFVPLFKDFGWWPKGI